MSTTAARATTLKVSRQARRALRLIAAHTEEKQYQVLERLLAAELAVLKIKS